MTDPEFSLLDEPWVLVRTREGETLSLSILDTFRRSPDLAGIVGDLPTQGFAILRVLLAILHRAVDGPADAAEWQALDAAGVPPMEDIEAYCRKHEDRFYLFHPTQPFFQVAGLHTAKNEFSGLEKLVADVPAGHPYFTTRVGDGLTSLTPAEAARWVVHAQAFDCSGIKSGAVGDPRVKGGKGYPIGTGWAGVLGGVYVEGESLWRTLLLNLIPESERGVVSDRDRPAWEAEPAGSAEARDIAYRPHGPLDLFTWQSRRIVLHRGPGGVDGVVLANGDKLAPPYRRQFEPMTGWRRSIPQEKKLKLPLVYMPREHRPSRAFWRGLGSTLPGCAPLARAREGADAVAPAVFDWAAKARGRRAGGRHTVTLRAVGMSYGTQSATVADIFDDQLVVSVDLLRETGTGLPELVGDAVEDAEAAVMALRNLSSNLVKAAGGTDARLADGARERAAERGYAALDPLFRDWVQRLDASTEVTRARQEWQRIVHRVIGRIGGALVNESGPAAWVGREVSGRRLTSPEADGWFRTALAKALPGYRPGDGAEGERTTSQTNEELSA